MRGSCFFRTFAAMKQVTLGLKPSYRYILPENYISDGHDFVEIGGIRWATMNVGAKDVTDSGLYFAWGETKGYKPEEVGKTKRFTWKDYKYNKHKLFCNIQLSKYNDEDKLITLRPQDDPVTANWGGAWRLPTKEEFVALGDAVTTEWVKNYQGSGVNGRLMTDKNDSTKQLFFPAAGCGSDGSVCDVGPFGDYWSSSLYKSVPMYSHFLDVASSYVEWDGYGNRHHGFSVRGVLDV